MELQHVVTVSDDKKIVVIVGAGFGGLNAAKALSNKPDVQVVLIDQKNHHLFQPLLYQVATAGLNPADIAVPVRSQFSDVDNVAVHLAKITVVDLEKKTLQVDGSENEFGFDYLILACGARHSYFAHPEWEEYAPGLKTLEQATEIRRRILLAFEHAENELDEEKRNTLLNFVVIGGGPTGVELAGAIADISRTVLVRDFKRINPSTAKVILLEAGPRLLSAFSEDLSEHTRKALTSLGVEVRTHVRVENITAEGVYVGTDFIPTKSAFWAAGVQANSLNLIPSVDRDPSGRIKVRGDLSIPNHPDIFVIGDMAAIEMADGKLVPGLAPAAIQEGVYVARAILSSMQKKPRENFHYWDKGLMATIGKNKAIMQAGNIHMTGRFAWLGWFFIHIFYLIGFKNRISVLLQWTWSYVFAKRGSRLITEKGWKLSQQKEKA